MKFLNFLFPSKPEFGASVIDPQLGEISWDAKYDEWTGEFNGLKFSIDYQPNQLRPTAKMIEYTCQVLLKPNFLTQCLTKETEEFIKKVPKIRNFPEQLEEMNSLYIESVHIGENSNGYYSFVCLGPELPNRVWRMELAGLDTNGLGFDS